jgi:predicted membrane channel-forming protein YqfA (hemolysin III family)
VGGSLQMNTSDSTQEPDRRPNRENVKKIDMKMIENFSKEEEITNALLHGIGSGVAVTALVLLIVFANINGTAWHILYF